MNKCPRCTMVFHGQPFICPQCNYKPRMKEGVECFAPDFDKATAGFSSDSFEGLFEKEAGSFWFRARNELILWAMNRFFPNAESFLEVGCGTGFVLKGLEERMPHLSLTGSELFPAGLRWARLRLNERVRLFQMDARNIPFVDEFDVVGGFDVLEHIIQDEEVLAQFCQAVKTGGGMILTVPQHRWLWSQLDVIAKHERRYAKKELICKMEKVGFKVVMATSFVSVLMPFMLLSRLRKMDVNKAHGELALPGWVDRVLDGFMAVERSLIKDGVRFPFGGSLLTIGIAN